MVARHRLQGHTSDKAKCYTINEEKFDSNNPTFSDKLSITNKSMSTDASVNHAIYEQRVLQTCNECNLAQEHNSRQVTV